MQTISMPDNIDDILAALADPTRRAILTRLSAGPARVTDLAAPFNMSLNSVSKHIRILERADLVVRFREGREHVLTFNPGPVAAAQCWLSGQQQAWADNLDALDAQLVATDTHIQDA